MFGLQKNTFDFSDGETLCVPDKLQRNPRPHKIIAEGLCNPRGMCVREDGSVMFVEAGAGLAEHFFSGRISCLRPHPAVAGEYLAPEILAEGFRSLNMQSRMYRDEIMGLADIAMGNGECMLSQTDYIGGSGLLRLQGDLVTTVFAGSGNLNSICWHPLRKTWMAIKPDRDVLVEFNSAGDEVVLAHFPKCSQGQDAVPVTVIYEASTGAVLVSLFSGERNGTPELKGIDFVAGEGKIVRVWPQSAIVETLVSGLQFPTGIALRGNRELLALELCDEAREPLDESWAGECRHGGYTRYSGRLLCIDLSTAAFSILASGLDTPSNLCLLSEDRLLVSEGMGLSGRLIPGPDGQARAINGAIRMLEL